MNSLSDCYSPLKIFHHREWIEAMRSGNNPPPIFVEIIPTNRCNQDCHFCAYRISGYSSNEQFEEKDQLSWEKLQEVVHDCASMGVKAIELTGGGEPTLHKSFLPLCELIVNSGRGLGLVTNGSIWSNDHMSVLSRAEWVRFSLDAASASTYMITRRSTQQAYERVRANIRSLVGKGPIVGVGYVVTHENWQELEAAARAAYDDGVNNLRISAVFQNDGVEYFAGFKDQVLDICRRIKERYHGTHLKIFDLFTDRLNDLTQGSPDYSFCGFQQASTYVGADYNVYRCCVLAYNARGLLGSIKDRSFAELWKFLDFSDFDARGCPRCMFNRKNETIAYAISKNPMHVDFI